MSKRELQRQIDRTIKQYYGWNIGSFRPELDYFEGLAPFLWSLTKALTGRPDNGECNAPFARADVPDKEIGNRLKGLRLKKSMTLTKVAAKMGVHSDYLNGLEDGKVMAFPHHIGGELRAMKATRKEKDYVYDYMMSYSANLTPGSHNAGMLVRGLLDQRVRDVIDHYYGLNLWIFRPEVSYEESIAPFVQSLLCLEVEYRASARKDRAQVLPAPPEGYKWLDEGGRRKVVIDEVTARKKRGVFEDYIESSEPLVSSEVTS